MNSRSSRITSIALTVALAASVSAVARADDNSMSIWTGESYAAFNGGKDFPYGKPAIHTGPPAFRQTNPHGLSDRDYMALNTDNPTWQTPNPDAASQLAASDTATAWRASHPHGFSPREYEAMSATSAGYAWRLTAAEIQATAAENDAAVAKLDGREPMDERVARFFQGRWKVSAN